MTRKDAARRYRVTKDAHLKQLRTKQVAKIKKQRRKFQDKKTQRLSRERQAVDQREGKLQKELTTKQLKRRHKSIKRNIAKQSKLKYKKAGGDVAMKKLLEKETNWVSNFYSSNVWKFKIRGKNLLVQFLDGSTYIYYGAANLFLGMRRTGSKGKYVWNQLIRKNVNYTKLR